MPRKCSVCEHSRSEEITLELLGNAPLRSVAKKYSLSVSALQRHKQHIARQMLLPESAEITEPLSVMERVKELDARADCLYNEAMRNNDHLNAVRALKELREITALYAKLTGELNAQAQVVHQHLHITPEWISLRQTMLAALAPYPEARAALIEAIGGIEDVQG